MPNSFAFAVLAWRVPALWELLAAAYACPLDDWRRFEVEVMTPLRALLGWHAPEETPSDLRSTEAYELAHIALVWAFETPARERAA